MVIIGRMLRITKTTTHENKTNNNNDQHNKTRNKQ